MQDSESTVVRSKQPCPDCGSSDALAEYSDGHTYCFSCETYTAPDGEKTSETHSVSDEFHSGSYGALSKRGLTEQTCRQWSYMTTTFHGERVQCANYLDNNRQLVAQKFRTRDKSFPWINRQAFRGLYGRWLWRDTGKMVVITEGELDAMSVCQAMGGSWPVVSLPDGGGKNAVKAIKEDLSWLQGYSKVILFFDNDEKGRDTFDLVKRLLPVGKCYYCFAPDGYKDASDLLMARKSKAIIDLVWGAKQYRPDGMVSGQTIIDRLLNRPQVTSYPYPDFMDGLNFKTGGGMRFGELDTWTSGTGMGKTTIIKALQNHLFHTTNFNQALIHLEEPLEDTADDLIAYELGHRFQLELAGEGDVPFRDTGEYLDTAEALFLAQGEDNQPRFQLYDAFGSLEDDESLYDIIRYAAKADNCKFVWLDHLSILVSDGPEGDDERKRIDRIMHNLKSLTVELDIYIGLISHLRKPVGSGNKSFEEGATPTLDDLRGSGGIKQLSNAVFAISRNQQAESDAVRSTSTVTVLKCRKTGRTGTADHLLYDDVTGRLSKGVDPDALSLNSFDNEEEY